MSLEESTADRFYRRLFTEDATWSTPYPNVEEARRAARILPILSELAREAPDGLRILDVGCGRGWLTHLADAYGSCVGVEPVAAVVEFAREQFPDLRFEAGTTRRLLEGGEGHTYDVVLASEVIEHVPVADRGDFVDDLRALLASGGAVVLTTDRGEQYRRWRRRATTTEQPEENWLTEREVRRLFEGRGFVAVHHDRAYFPLPDLSLFHRVVASARFARTIAALRQGWLLEGLRYAAANCQVWLFRAER
jgi:SAM-dependent methyltransferase